MTDLCVRQIRMAWPSGKRNSGDGIRGRTGCVYKRHVKEGGLRYGRVGRTRVCRGEHEGGLFRFCDRQELRRAGSCPSWNRMCHRLPLPQPARNGKTRWGDQRRTEKHPADPEHAVECRVVSACRSSDMEQHVPGGVFPPCLPVSCNAERAAAQTFR